MKKTILTCFLMLLLGWNVAAQLSLVLTGIPANTPANATLYLAGNFNNWNPGDPAYTLTPTGNGLYTITINPPAGALQFKFTRGSWATVEGGPNGEEIANRTFTYSGQPVTATFTVQSWKDLAGSGNNSTAAPNVSVLSTAFYMPQLNRNRRIWIYLPPDYATAVNKHYPVLYMHDGQNLFDVTTSAFGEWRVDESLNTLFAQGNRGCIVVGIDNGGSLRLDEYSPWVNTQYGGGEGELYVEFIANTLKPYIDSLYRTLPGRQYTGIMGSSMGGLISMYGLIERQDVFAKAGIFSPAFWFAGNESVNHVIATGKSGDVRVYFLAGGAEPVSVAQNMAAVVNAMHTTGFQPSEDTSLVVPGGQHSEWFWAQEFPAAYLWLFGDITTSVSPVPQDTPLAIFPNPAGSAFRISGLPPGERIPVKILRADGSCALQTNVQGGEAIGTAALPPGVYVVKIGMRSVVSLPLVIHR